MTGHHRHGCAATTRETPAIAVSEKYTKKAAHIGSFHRAVLSMKVCSELPSPIDRITARRSSTYTIAAGRYVVAIFVIGTRRRRSRITPRSTTAGAYSRDSTAATDAAAAAQRGPAMMCQSASVMMA